MKKKRKTIEQMLKEREIERELSKKYNLDDEGKKVVIEKKNSFIEFMRFIQNSIGNLVKIIFFILITILSSIGLTVIVNSSLRELFFDLIKIF